MSEKTFGATPMKAGASRTRASRLGRALPDGPLALLYGVTFAIVLYLVIVPIGALIYGSLRTSAPGMPGEWTIANWVNLATTGVVGSIFTTVYIALLTSVFSVAIGTAIAIVVHRTDFRYPNLVTALVGLAFYLPSFILAMAWIIIGSRGGVLNQLLQGVLGFENVEVDIYTVAGIVFVMVLHQVPFVYLTMRGPIIGMDPVYEEAARTSGATPVQVLVRVTLPLLGYPILSSFILTFIVSLEQFAIPALIGIPGHITVLATQLYLLCRFPPVDYGLAAAIGLALSALTGAAIWAQRRVARGARLVTVTGKAGRLAPIRLGRWRWPAYVLCFGFIALSLVLPAVILVYTSLLKWFTANPLEGMYTLRNYVFIWNSPATMRSIWNTLVVSGVGAAIGVVLALSCAYFTLRLTPPGHRALDLSATLPFGVPGIVVGLGLLWAYAYLPLPLYGTLAIIVLAFVTRFLPYATEAIGGQMVQIDRSLEEAAWTSGATRLQGAARIILPIAFPAVQSAYFLLFMAFFREISSAILLFTASTSVISIAIWTFFEQANWGQASALSVVTMGIIFVVIAVILKVRPRLRQA